MFAGVYSLCCGVAVHYGDILRRLAIAWTPNDRPSLQLQHGHTKKRSLNIRITQMCYIVVDMMHTNLMKRRCSINNCNNHKNPMELSQSSLLRLAATIFDSLFSLIRSHNKQYISNIKCCLLLQDPSKPVGFKRSGHPAR